MMEVSFDDRYHFIEELERGRCLVSYLARDEMYGLEVVVDAVELGKSAAPHLHGRLKEILDRAGEITAPHIAALFAWREEGGRVFMVREKVEGVPLAEVLAEVGELPREQVVEITRAAAETLAEAYGKGLFYLGLNPGQVVLGRRGEVRFIRVGFGWLVEEMEPLLAARVSPYRAPETDGCREGARTSDVYSLAVMIREMLPRREESGRLHTLLERSMDPLPKHRPSSPRLLLESLEGEGEERAVLVPSSDSLEDAAGGDRGGKRGGRPSVAEIDEAPAAPLSLAKRTRGRPLRTLLMILLGGVIIWLLYAAVSGSLAGKGKAVETTTAVTDVEKVTLPDLQGLSAQEAEEILSGLGMSFTSRQAPSRLWSAGVVVAQEPGAGSVLQPGDTVCLVISSGRDDGLDTPAGGQAGNTATGLSENPSGGTISPGSSGVDQPPGENATSDDSSSSTAPLAPRATASLSTRGGPAPLYVVMDGSRSSDPDGSIARYVWDCGDGTFLEGRVVQHVYDPTVAPMRFQVSLRVYDHDGLSDSCAVTVEVY